MIRPSKFALSFTFGSICAMGAFAMLKGPAAYLSGLMELKKLPLTGAYVLTLVSTLYSCLVLGNYILVVCSSVLQLVTLSAFALSALPGGQNSLKGECCVPPNGPWRQKPFSRALVRSSLRRSLLEDSAETGAGPRAPVQVTSLFLRRRSASGTPQSDGSDLLGSPESTQQQDQRVHRATPYYIVILSTLFRLAALLLLLARCLLVDIAPGLHSTNASHMS